MAPTPQPLALLLHQCQFIDVRAHPDTTCTYRGILEHLARHIHITTLSLLIDEDYDTHPTTARPNANGDNTCTNNNQVFDTTGIQMIRDNNTITAPRSRVPRVHQCIVVTSFVSCIPILTME